MSSEWHDGRLVTVGSSHERPGAGWGVFTTVGCDGGRPLLWSFHWERLFASLARLGAGQLVRLPDENALRWLLDANDLQGPARVRVSVRAGIDSVWRVAATAVPCSGEGPSLGPVRLVVQRWQGVPPLAGHKMLRREKWELARKRALEDGADDALLVDGAGNVFETSVANIWIRHKDTLLTPPAPEFCLPGVMRRWLLENSDDFGISVRESDLRLDDVAAADEVLISNAVVGFRRVSRVIDRRWSRWPLFEQIAAYGVPAPGWLHQDSQ